MAEKRLFTRIFIGSTVRELRVKKQLLKDSLNLVGTMRSSLKRNKGKTDLQNKIKNFFKRDDVSRTTAEDIENISKELPRNITRLQGTFHVHQFTSTYGELMHRTLSCFCERGFCKCLELKIYHPVPLVSTTTADASVDNDTAMVIPSSPTDSAYAIGACGDNNIVNTLSSSMSSDDDVPLNRIKSRCSGAIVITASKPLAEINYTDLAKDAGKRGTVYDMVYCSIDASNEENQPTTSGNNKMLPSNGDFLLVNVHAGKNKTYTYASLAQSDLEDDGEIKVIFLRAYKGATKFKLDENDLIL
ncbi:unnamed protein product [Parnassius apollo]|uniref:(apollo) hypothetical protein n=1 Tax=Parnassius apollo TaxID=110799 RepID=A0A8S3Y6M9_PARAO|nr:unnamed protein product [Parnassius apollo]